jgi:hypothetical protein
MKNSYSRTLSLTSIQHLFGSAFVIQIKAIAEEERNLFVVSLFFEI